MAPWCAKLNISTLHGCLGTTQCPLATSATVSKPSWSRNANSADAARRLERLRARRQAGLVRCNADLSVLVQDLRPSKVTSAGQLPTGFDPAALYPSRSHPRGLQMTVYGASDALRSTGFTIDELKSLVRPDQIGVYSGSAMGQLDQDGYGGLMQNALTGKRPTSKILPLVSRKCPATSSMPMCSAQSVKPPASLAPAPLFCIASNAAWTRYAAAASASSSSAMRKLR